jgi:peroxiredoxin
MTVFSATRYAVTACIAWTTYVGLPTVTLQAATTAAIGRKIKVFALRDYHGKECSLQSFQDAKVVVVAFLGAECPLAGLYGRRLSELQKEYADRSVAFVGIDSNRQDSMTDLAAYARRHQVDFPLLKDPGNKIADVFGAQRTPQVFVLDQSRSIRYAGAIDDQYGVGFQRKKAEQRYLAEAIESLLNGKAVTASLTTAVGCQIGRVPKTEPTGEVTYAKDIAPIFNRRCVECHRAGEIAPFPLVNYDDVMGWEDMIVEVISENRMPPWLASPEHGEFKNDARLIDVERDLIKTWVKNGSPKGNEADLPPNPTFAEGWRYRTPDQVIKMNDTAFDVPADGVVDYQYYVVDPHWDEDKYIVSAEARPDNRAVVHHIIAYLIAPGVDPREDHDRRMLVGYAPGSPPTVLGEGLAIHVEAGSKLLFEMHYTPNGVAQTDLSYIGVTFTERDKVKNVVNGRAAINHKFTIPPQTDNYEVVAKYKSREDELLLRMMPHMHLRGKAFKYEAIYPDDRREVLLDVPAYDFNWQLSYELSTPKLLLKGTRIVCTAHYNNSASNRSNPDPAASVRWGQQSWEEMMIGFFDVVPANYERQASKASLNK